MHVFRYESARLGVRLVAGQGRSHADHLRKSDDGAEDYSRNVEPMGVQPVISESAKSIAEKDCRGNDETDLRIASRRYQGIRLARALGVVGHERDSTASTG